MQLTKFRYYDSELFKMVYPEENDLTRVISWQNGALGIYDWRTVNFALNERCVLMQHTGLFVNGNLDLYELDIIRLPNNKIFFSDNLVKYHLALKSSDLTQVVKIGNTFEIFKQLESRYNWALNRLRHYIFLLWHVDNLDHFDAAFSMINIKAGCKGRGYDLSLSLLLKGAIHSTVKDAKDCFGGDAVLAFGNSCSKTLKEVKKSFNDLKDKFNNYDFTKHQDNNELHKIFVKNTSPYSNYDDMNFSNDEDFIKTIIKDVDYNIKGINNKINKLCNNTKKNPK